MARLKVGDVFEIVTPKGKAYIQYVLNNGTIGELIRVLPGVYDNQPHNLEEIVEKTEKYFVDYDTWQRETVGYYTDSIH